MPSPYRMLRAPSTWPRIDNGAEHWRTRALCVGHELPPETWDDAVDADGPRGEFRRERIEAAKAVCRKCPVRVECLADVRLDLDEGVRGAIDLRNHRFRSERKAQ